MGHGFLRAAQKYQNSTKDLAMSPMKRYANKQIKARKRRRLNALPKRSRLKRLRRLGLEMLVSIWRHAQDKSASTRSRWQWRWVVDDSVFRKYGKQFGLVGTWYSGQFKRTVPGIDGVLLLVVIGDGKLIIPIDFAIR